MKFIIKETFAKYIQNDFEAVKDFQSACCR